MERRTSRFILIGFVLVLSPLTVSSTELVYVPVNPDFGGSPLNGPVLLSNAQAQDDHKDPQGDLRSQSPLQQFNDALQRSVLNRIASSITGTLIGPSGDLIPGVLETKDFIIQIQDLGGGVMKISTTDKTTGASTTFEVSSEL